jgi:hypothetical protein
VDELNIAEVVIALRCIAVEPRRVFDRGNTFKVLGCPRRGSSFKRTGFDEVAYLEREAQPQHKFMRRTHVYQSH